MIEWATIGLFVLAMINIFIICGLVKNDNQTITITTKMINIILVVSTLCMAFLICVVSQSLL